MPLYICRAWVSAEVMEWFSEYLVPSAECLVAGEWVAIMGSNKESAKIE